MYGARMTALYLPYVTLNRHVYKFRRKKIKASEQKQSFDIIVSVGDKTPRVISEEIVWKSGQMAYTESSLKSAEQEGGYKGEGKTWVPEIESM